MSQRLAKEYRALSKTLGRDPEYAYIISLAPVSEENLRKWESLITGPPDTPYFGHEFTLQIEASEAYPLEPPKVQFQARCMPHCNVDFDSGRICLSVLDAAHWTPAWDLLHVVHAIWLLLASPEPDSPLDVDLACLVRAGDRSAHNSLIAYYLNGGSRGHCGHVSER
ncbi:UBC core domain-containing protein [Lachancea thermotolerans]|uniref:KLTH0F14894p n=1 Tax=Lachancea thermotolerans (strain ATCC 56472 / CBS 6340 / NRRL Y-8284) TaxID=559295 RepID=C5DJA7_LACTC|nr:KLTH0F14894p [Lachancea thermotolerans CBS 6340]CAR24396.1 KLTH0F14894p [Lachancea thermotolerans CBS 6340]